MSELGAAERAALEEERAFLLASLRDLDAELAAGDLDVGDHRVLAADYTRRAAAVLRRLEGQAQRSEEGAHDRGASSSSATDGSSEHAVVDAESAAAGRPGGVGRRRSSSPDEAATAPDPSPWRRRLLVVAGVALLAAISGALVAQASGRRGSQGLTGLDVAEASSRLGDCQSLEAEGDPDAALDCYDEILVSLPANVPALTFRGWLQVRSGDLEAGIADLDAAVQVDAGSTAPHLFRAIARIRQGEPVSAIDDLARFVENEPVEEERTLASDFIDTIVPTAVDACVAGDVDGSLAPIDVATCYQNVLTVDSDNATAQIYLGWLLGRGGVTAEALDLLDAGIAAAPETDTDRSAGLVFRAAVRAHAGNVDGARTDLDTFDSIHATAPRPADQVAAATEVRTALDEGRDPLT